MPPRPIYDGHEFEAVRYRHENATAHLRWLMDVDLRVFFGLVAVQLGVGAWLVANAETITDAGRWCLGVLDLAACVVALWMHWFNAARREEYRAIVQRCREALGFQTVGAFQAVALEAGESKALPWFSFYCIGIAVMFAAIAVALVWVRG